MKPLSPPVRRLRILLLVLAAWGCAIGVRLVYVQVLQHDDLLAQSLRQQQKSTRVAALRGTIYDRTGKPLAQTLESDSVLANPKLMPNLSQAADLLGKTLNLDARDLLRKFQAARSAKGTRFVYVARKLTAAESERVRALKLKGIEFEPGMRRYYPRGELAAHVLGAMGHVDPPAASKLGASLQNAAYEPGKAVPDPPAANADVELGTAGIERLFDKELSGQAGKVRIYRDSLQRIYNSEVLEAPVDGEDITLTIDPNMQYQAEFELREAVRASGAKGGTVVALDPYTGEVLAMASYPSYDPNLPQAKGKEAAEARSNLAIAANFEPGSVFKVITLAAALENTRLTPRSMINCLNGQINLAGRVVHDHKRYSALSMAEVLAHSSNVGAIQIALQTGNRPLYEAQKNFGFGAKTGIELPAESSGRLWPVEKWTKSSIGSLAMGHEVTVTSLQLAVAGAVIANGGLRVKPRIILSRQRPGQPAEKTPLPKAERILRPESAIQMRQMMEGVVLSGTGRRAVLKGYTSGGKTGSAQIYDPATGKYTHDYNASFLGFAPVTNPRVVVSVSLFGTTGGETGYGGVRAAPVFREVAMGALRIMDVPKDLPGSIESEPASDAFDDNDLPAAFLEGKEEQDLMAGLETTSLPKLRERSTGQREASASPKTKSVREAKLVRDPSVSSVTQPLARGGNPATDSTAGQRPFLPERGMPVTTGPAAPDFRGLTLRAVMERSAAAGVAVRVNGTGLAVTQDPAPGAVLRPGSVIRVQLAR